MTASPSASVRGQELADRLQLAERQLVDPDPARLQAAAPEHRGDGALDGAPHQVTGLHDRDRVDLFDPRHHDAHPLDLAP